MQAVSKLLARPHHLRRLWGLSAGSRLNQVVAREGAAAVADASQAGANPSVAGAGVSSEAASDPSPSLISPHRPSLAERRRQRKNNGPRIEGDTVSESSGREGGFRARTFSQQAERHNGVPIRIESGNLSGPPGQFLDEGADLAGGPPRRTFTRVEARTRQFSDAVRFLNKDTGRPPAKKKPVVQPVIVSKGKFPESWEGPNGSVILVDKPLEWSSHQACSRLKFQLKLKKIGHAGTLDPMASGLLILVAGPATKLMEVYQAQTKRYSGTIRLGETTPSLDVETEVDELFPWEHITDEFIASTSGLFLGDIMQIPPIYSALQVDGERLYKKARRGETMDIPARPVTIESLQLWRDADIPQHVHFEVVCSKGTYVRSLARDIGTALDTGAHLIALRREAIGDFDVKDAWDIEDLLTQWKVHKEAQRESRIFRPAALKGEASEEPTRFGEGEEVLTTN